MICPVEFDVHEPLPRASTIRPTIVRESCKMTPNDLEMTWNDLQMTLRPPKTVSLVRASKIL